MDIFKEGSLRFIKMIDLSFLGILYFLFASLSSVGLDKLFPEYEEEVYSKKDIFDIFLECVLIISLIMIIIYIIRNIIQIIPFPLDGYMGYKHSRLKEMNGGVLLSFSVVIFQNSFKDKILHLFRRLRINR